ncbi:deoxynucleoside triphosphate triphosphohydrolase SAMHD1-like protein [Labeo rohita]|uniref:Deoxynucleoside triphosphate triphosphohydrolase SAMHD1-like protein n=1 Tax=Labeo rohita TaxID=84645 RepID=A0A498NI29_LABRO|nr:deoxynucleoside triphosphate triphosphohydrolase SAMHD1-like protein [Labeo rohita]
MSVLMFDDIMKSLKAENEDVLKEHGLEDKHVTFIKELIEGAKTSEWDRDEDKSFLYEIVANKQNGIDVDKWDYFARDCHHLGIRNSFDHQRLLKFARVCKVNGRNHICFRDKEADNVYDMFRTRYTLHRQAYQHKIGYIIEDMFAKALIKADRDLHEGKPEDMLKISEAIKTVDDYSKLTDEIFEQISSSTVDSLKESRDILNKIVRRKLPKFVGEARLTEKNKSKEELTETWKAAVEKYKPTDPTVSLKAEDFTVHVVDLDHGIKDKNPIEKVYFYSKRNPNEASAIKDYQIFNDPIHGHIELHPLLVKIIDTPQFQRLRHIKQLGGKYLVYPGASHNRFEHSLGVAYLAGCLVKILHDNQPELSITDQDILCVQIAGLCHDLGHGPLSHVFDGLVIPEAKKIKRSQVIYVSMIFLFLLQHEQMSVLMFDDIVKSLKAENEDVLKKHGLDDKDVTFIKELIEGAKTSEWTFKGRDEEKSFLFEIVANKQNGIDVDKWDYFARDCHHLGIRNSFDHQRLLKFARVCEVNGRKHICFRDKEADNVYDMFRTRYTLHRQAYQHKICNIIEDMFAKALIKADRDLHKGKPEDMLKISEAIKTVDDYSKLTDEIFEQISSSTVDSLKESRDILNKIVRRKLPKFVGEARLTEKNKSKEELTETWKAAVEKYKPTDPTVSLKAEDFTVQVVDLDHGMKDKNPIEKVYFYSKRKRNEASAIKDYQIIGEFRGNERLITGDCPSLDDCGITEVHSCKVHRGFWKLYEGLNYNEAEYTLEPEKEYRTPTDWDCQSNTSARSLKHIFNDPIHGHMELHPLLVKIIDTPQFQRLRRIKQLGGAYLVYPGASHNRFEHSLGVAYLAGCLVKTLHDNQPELKITKQDFLCVQIAGLCHDLGHGPFSHVFDGLVIPKTKKIKRSKGLPDDIPEKWKHEQMSVLMFDDIVKSLKAENEDVLKEHGLDDKDVTFIKELIEGAKTSEWTHKGRDEEKSFLYEIVANKQNGIDVDKWDYFARDCHHLGIRNSFDHQRLLKFARVCEVNGRKHICFRDKEADNVYDMFRTRYTLHRQAYQHKICNIIENLLAEALIRADRNLHERKPEDMLKISEAIKTADDYSKLTDEIFEQISSSTADSLKESRDILNKIIRRKLPKFVGEARLTEKNKSKEELTETWKAAVEKYKPTDPTVSLNAEDFSVYVVDLDHGMKDKNPIEYVYFYSKRKPNEASAIKDYQL